MAEVDRKSKEKARKTSEFEGRRDTFELIMDDLRLMIGVESASIGVDLRFHILYVPLRHLRLRLLHARINSTHPTVLLYEWRLSPGECGWKSRIFEKKSAGWRPEAFGSTMKMSRLSLRSS